MSDFNAAADHVFANEGGFAHLKGDTGGETQFGISQAWLDSIGAKIKARDVTQEMARNYMRVHWWDEYHYGDVDDQALATELLDFAFLAGPKAAHLCIQRALRACGFTIKEDGVLGPVTRATIARARPCCLLAAFIEAEAGYLRDLDRPEFEKGWTERAYRRWGSSGVAVG